MKIKLKKPPDSELLENAILQCLIMNPSSYFNIPPAFNSKYFSKENKYYFENLEKAITNGEKIDAVLAHFKLEGHNPEQILIRFGQDAISSNIAYYCEKLMEIRKKEMFYLHLENAKQILLENGVASALSYLQETQEGQEAMKTLLPPTANDVIKGMGKDGQIIETGFSVLDKFITMRTGNLVVLAALTNIGKTTLALNIAQNIAKKGYASVFHSYEMTDRELAIKVLASEKNIKVIDLIHNGDQYKEPVEGGSNLYFNTRIHELSKVMAMTRRLATLVSLRLVVVDYVQLATPKFKGMTRAQEVGYVCRKFSMLSKELGVLTILLSQLNRDADTERFRPRLKHLRDSGEIEQYADIVLFLHPQDATTMEIIPEKIRLGPNKRKRLCLKTNFAFSKFIDPTKT